MRVVSFISLLLLLGTSSLFADPAQLGAPAPDFKLKDFAGREHSLAELKGQTVVLGFLGVKCPVSAAYSSRISAIASSFSEKGVTFLGINSNAHESINEIRANAEKSGYVFPVLKDEMNRVADMYGATVTPEMFVIDNKGILRYHGRVDNASDPARVERQDLKLAIEEVLKGDAPLKPFLKAYGCQIQRVPAAKTTSTSEPTAQPKVSMLKPQDFADLKKASAGKVLVVNFWATWCAPCVAEFPEFVKLHESYKDKGVRMVSISTDETGDIKSAVIPFLKKQNAGFEVFVSAAADPQDLIDVVDKNWSGALPATFVFDKAGKLVLTKYGIIDRDELIKVVEASIK